MGKTELNLKILMELTDHMRRRATDDGDIECADAMADVMRDLGTVLEAVRENH